MFEEGDLDGNSAFWAEDEEDGAEGFLDALEDDMFWNWDDLLTIFRNKNEKRRRKKIEKEKEKEDQDEDFSGREKFLAARMLAVG